MQNVVDGNNPAEQYDNCEKEYSNPRHRCSGAPRGHGRRGATRHLPALSLRRIDWPRVPVGQLRRSKWCGVLSLGLSARRLKSEALSFGACDKPKVYRTDIL